MAVAKHYRWDEVEEDAPRELVTRKRVVGEKAMVSRLVLEAGCRVPVHSHENEQIAYVVEGELLLEVGERGEVFTVGAGEVLVIPGGMPHAAEAKKRTVVLDIFSPPSERTGVDQA